jgi:hypothetical protein
MHGEDNIATEPADLETLNHSFALEVYYFQTVFRRGSVYTDGSRNDDDFAMRCSPVN